MNRSGRATALRQFAVMGALGCTAALLPALAGCGGPPVVDGGPLENHAVTTTDVARDAAAWLAGHYSSAAQAAADPTFFDVRLHIVPIWTDRTDGPWMYVEQAMADAQDKPYRQRIYRIIPLPQGRAESVIYELPGDPLLWAGAWRDASRFNALDPGIIVARPGCSVVLASAGPGALKGSTNGADCGSALRGAAYATSEVTVTAAELTSWDRGFDATGKQVWGSVTGPYRFVKESAVPSAPPPPEPPMGDEAAVAVPPSESATR